MNTTFPYDYYYQDGFLDPLYQPYLDPNRVFKFNPWLMNPNEVRINKGYTFKKKYSHFPCPPGFRDIGLDYCERYIQQIPQFYTPHHLIPTRHFDFINKTTYNNTNMPMEIDMYTNPL